MSNTAGEERGSPLITIGVAGAGVAMILLLSWCRFGEIPALPAKPAAPRVDKAAFARMSNESALVYEANLDEDATRYGVAKPTVADMSTPWAYESAEIKQKLAPGATPLETASLRLSVRSAPLDRRSRAGSMKAAHLILTIQNKTQGALAYRVKTSVGNDTSCQEKSTLPHNALVLGPGETIERTECLFHDGRTLTVQTVESLQVPPLAYHYLSRLQPLHIGLDSRTAQGHRAPKGSACSTIPQQLIAIGLDKGTVSWRDLIDFYGRHRCETYSFPMGYRAVTAGKQISLPVTAAQVAGGQ